MSQIKTKFIVDNAVTNAKLAQAATLTIKGNNTGGAANVSDLTVSQVNTMLGDILANGSVAFTADQSMGNHKLTNVTDPSSAQDAATKAYVDNGLAQLNPKEAVNAASTANITGTYLNGVAGIGATFTVTATGAFVVDGYTTLLGDRVLLKNQTSGFQNGIYDVTTAGALGVSAILTRSLDYDTASDMNDTGVIPVINGTVNNTTSWLQTATITTVGTDSLVFTQWSKSPSSYASSTLTGAHLFVGNGSNVATDVAVSGDLTLANTGAFTVAKIQTTTVSGTTGSGNVVFSASPTLTGTITAAVANFSGAISASNLSGTNTGDVTLAAVGSSPSANGASLSSQVLTLQPFDSTHPGVVTASGGGTSNFLRADGTWAAPSGGASVPSISDLRYNMGLSTSVAANAMTINLTDAAGSTPSGGSSVSISFRSSTATTGTYNVRTASSAVSLVIPSSATLGTVSGQSEYLYVYALDNSGTIELAVAGSVIVDDGTLQNTTLISGSATSDNVLYSNPARNAVPIRLIGRIAVTETTAGTWASNATEVSTKTLLERLTFKNEIYIRNGNGYGSTATAVRRFSTTQYAFGSISFADSSVNGSSFTAMEDGIYAITYTDREGGTSDMLFGITKNMSPLTNNITNLPDAQRLTVTTSNKGQFACTSITTRLKAGDVIRAVTDGSTISAENGRDFLQMIKISS